MGHLVTLFQKNKVIVQDGFNRADNTLTMGNADTGQAWTTYIGTLVYGISGGKGYIASGSGFGIKGMPTAQPNAEITAKITYKSGESCGTFFRNDGTANNYLQTYTFNNTVQLHVVLAGVDTLLGSFSVTLTDGAEYTLKVQCAGPNIKVYLDGLLVISTTSASLTSNSIHGLRVFPGATLQSKIDNFLVEAL